MRVSGVGTGVAVGFGVTVDVDVGSIGVCVGTGSVAVAVNCGCNSLGVDVSSCTADGEPFAAGCVAPVTTVEVLLHAVTSTNNADKRR